MNSYIKIAEAVLKKSRQPLSAKEILDAAYRLQLVPTHLFGKTQHKTLQARLSEDILRNRYRSAFLRSGPGRFVLKPSKDLQMSHQGAYVAPLRAYQLKNFDVLCASRKNVEKNWGAEERHVYFEKISYLFDRQIPLREVDQDDKHIYLRIFIVVRHENAILSFVSHIDSDDIDGRGLGFIGYIKGSDLNLFSNDMFGIEEASRRTLAEQTSLPREVIAALRSLTPIEQVFSVQYGSPASASNFVVLITIYECQDPDEILRGVPTYRLPRWIKTIAEINNPDCLEPISQIVISDDILRRLLKI